MNSDSVHQKSETQPPEASEAVAPVTLSNTKQDTPNPETSSAGVTVLQWLTYAFWGGLILCLIWVLSVVLAHTILDENVTEVIPYAVAGTVVLLPLAFLCDLFYRKHEPLKKAGGAMVLMVVHAVLFALISIGSLIIAVFVGLNMLINMDSNLDSQTVGVLVALSSALLFAGAFLRTLNPFKTKKLAFFYSLVMTGITVLLLIFAVAGPIAKSVATRTDRTIERGLPTVKYAVDEYITQNSKLPESLDDVSVDASDTDAVELLDKNLVEYKPVKTTSTATYNLNDLSTLETKNDALINGRTTFRYELCVEYKEASNNGRGRNNTSDGYREHLTTYSHGAGRTCYKLEQTSYPSVQNVQLKDQS